MSGEHEVFMESSVPGYHTYFKYSTVSVGELMMCKIEENNDHDKYAVAVKNESGQIVGHVPIEISKIMRKFIRDYGEVEVECIGHRYNVGQGKGLEIPVDYRLLGNQQYLQRERLRGSRTAGAALQHDCGTAGAVF